MMERKLSDNDILDIYEDETTPVNIIARDYRITTRVVYSIRAAKRKTHYGKKVRELQHLTRHPLG